MVSYKISLNKPKVLSKVILKTFQKNYERNKNEM